MAFAGKVIPRKYRLSCFGKLRFDSGIPIEDLFGMTRGQEQIGFAFVQFLDEESSRVLRHGWLALPLCFWRHHVRCGVRKTIFLSQRSRQFRACERISYGQRFLHPCVARRFPHHVRRGFPKEIRIGVVVQLSGKSVNGPDEVLGGFMRGRDKAGIAETPEWALP